MAFAGISSTSVVKTGSRRAGLKRHHCHLPSANVTAVSHAILGLQGVQGQDFIVSDPVAMASLLDEQNELTQPDLGFPGLLQQALPCPSSPQASLSDAFSGPLSSWPNSFGCWKIPDPYSQAHLPSVPATCASCLSGCAQVPGTTGLYPHYCGQTKVDRASQSLRYSPERGAELTAEAPQCQGPAMRKQRSSLHHPQGHRAK